MNYDSLSETYSPKEGILTIDILDRIMILKLVYHNSNRLIQIEVVRMLTLNVVDCGLRTQAGT